MSVSVDETRGPTHIVSALNRLKLLLSVAPTFHPIDGRAAVITEWFIRLYWENIGVDIQFWKKWRKKIIIMLLKKTYATIYVWRTEK